MSLTLGLIGLGVGLAGTGAGILGSRKAAKRQKEELKKQGAANEAWYNRNYYGDYLNSVEAQNAIRRVSDTLRERSQAARAREAVTGATPEQTIAQEAESGRTVADIMGNLAAQGAAYRRDVDARKLQMDNALSAQRQAIAGQQQGANAALMSAGLQTAINSISQFDIKKPTLENQKA